MKARATPHTQTLISCGSTSRLTLAAARLTAIIDSNTAIVIIRQSTRTKFQNRANSMEYLPLYCIQSAVSPSSKLQYIGPGPDAPKCGAPRAHNDTLG